MDFVKHGGQPVRSKDPATPVTFDKRRVFVKTTRKQTPHERHTRDHAYAGSMRSGKHVGRTLVENVVFHLHDGWHSASDNIVALGQSVDRDTPMFDFALRFVGFEHVKAVPRLHILQRRIVQEIEINRLDAQPLQTALDTAADIVWCEIPHASHHVITAFGADEDLVAVRTLFEEGTNDVLAMSSAVGV